MTEHHLWKVEVLCEGLLPKTIFQKTSDRFTLKHTRVIVQAADGDAAMEQASRYAEKNASPDIDWKNFSPVSATRIALPFSADDF